MMLDVYAKTGYPDDAQYFYETQIRNGVPVDRRFHEVMMKNFIDRGYVVVCVCACARVVLVRMMIIVCII